MSMASCPLVRKAEATCGVKRQYLGCAGQVANGINTVHLSYVREGTGHALIGARQWIPREHLEDPVKSLVMGLPLDLAFRTKGQLAIDISTDAAAGGIRPDFYCGDEVYGNCTELRGHFEASGQAYVLRVPSNFMLTLAAGTKMTCAEAVAAPPRHPRRWEVRSAGERLQGRALVRLGVAGHRLPAALPADPPAPEDRGAGLPLLLRARRPAADQDPADQGGRAALASRRRFRIRQGLLRPRPVPGPAVHRDPSATPCWSWPPWPSAPSPPHCCATAPTLRRRPRSGLISRHRRTPA